MTEGLHIGVIRTLYAAALVGIVAVTTNRVVANEWPTHPILVVSPFGSGTTNDIVAHIVLDPTGAQLGQPFVLENRPGGSGSAGVLSVVKAPPDGYTFVVSSSAMSTAVILHKSLPYDALRDLEPVAMFGGEPSILMGAPGKGIVSVADLVHAARTNPDGIKFGSLGVGSPSHIAGERFRLLGELNANHVPYSGIAEALADLTAGRIDFYFVPVTPALPLITQGKAVPLAVSTPNRLPSLSGLPTLAESGYPIPTYLTWCGLSAPANTPHEVVLRLNAAITKALDLPAVRTKMLQTGFIPTPMSAEQFAGYFANEVTDMLKLAKEAHIDPQN